MLGILKYGRLIQPRRFSRKSVLWFAELLRDGGEIASAIVLDISPAGAKLAVKQNFKIGEVVYFCSPRTEKREARVVWAAADRIGIQFSNWDDSFALPSRRT